MALLFGSAKTLLCGFALSSLLRLRAAISIKADRSWKRYRNTEYGYCVSYPSRWVRGEAFEGAGLFVETGLKKFSRPMGAIDFEALSSAPKDARAVAFQPGGKPRRPSWRVCRSLSGRSAWKFSKNAKCRCKERGPVHQTPLLRPAGARHLDGRSALRQSQRNRLPLRNGLPRRSNRAFCAGVRLSDANRAVRLL